MKNTMILHLSSLPSAVVALTMSTTALDAHMPTLFAPLIDSSCITSGQVVTEAYWLIIARHCMMANQLCWHSDSGVGCGTLALLAFPKTLALVSAQIAYLALQIFDGAAQLHVLRAAA